MTGREVLAFYAEKTGEGGFVINDEAAFFMKVRRQTLKLSIFTFGLSIDRNVTRWYREERQFLERIDTMMRKKPWQGILKEFEDFLPVTRDTPALSLNEGNTPLVRAENIPKIIGFDGELYFKLEGLNPTGSFKDRGMVVAVAKAMEGGSEAIICASTGNTAASAAAYAARAGIRSIIVLPKGKVASGKLAQALIYGASVVEIEGNFDDSLRVVREIADNYKVALVNSINPYRLAGQKTAAFEIVDDLQAFPNLLFIPVGNAGNITAHWMGYQEYPERRLMREVFPFGFLPFGCKHKQNIFRYLPRMMGYQAVGAAPIAQGHIIEKPETIASAIRIGNPARWKEAEQAARESGGLIDSVTDGQILEAYKLLARYEGIFCEPSSATAFAGFWEAYNFGLVPPHSLVVCILTGNGLKDSETAASVCAAPYAAPSDSAFIANLFDLEKK